MVILGKFQLDNLTKDVELEKQCLIMPSPNTESPRKVSLFNGGFAVQRITLLVDSFIKEMRVVRKV